jgi:RHH-type transcriptional regulator, rel operon repressor / antitoxin RelB
MAETTSLSFRVSKAKAEQIERLAEAVDRPKSWLLQQALDAYLEVQAWHIAHIEQGRREIREGRGIPHDEVVRWVEGWAPGDGEISPPE